MVVREQASGYLCIPQSQHAAVSGALARAWGNEEFPAPTPLPEMCLAAEHHDDGMDDFDAEPDLDPETGLPRSFLQMPLDRWLECWRRGTALVAEDSPYAGLMTALHGVHLLGYRQIDPADSAALADADAFRSEQADLIEELIAECAPDPELEQYLDGRTIEHNRRLIALWDAMSLAVCMPRLPQAFEGVATFEEEATLRMEEAGIGDFGEIVIELDPWPFEPDEVRLSADGRLLTEPYDEEAEMRAALAAAPVRSLAPTLLRA